MSNLEVLRLMRMMLCMKQQKHMMLEELRMVWKIEPMVVELMLWMLPVQQCFLLGSQKMLLEFLRMIKVMSKLELEKILQMPVVEMLGRHRVEDLVGDAPPRSVGC